MTCPAVLADLGESEHIPRHHVWRFPNLLQGQIYQCHVEFFTFGLKGEMVEPTQKLRDLFDEVRSKFERFEPTLKTHILYAFRDLVTYQPEIAEEYGLSSATTEAEIVQAAGQPKLQLNYYIHGPKVVEVYEAMFHFPVVWDDEHGFDIPVIDGEVIPAVKPRAWGED